jgi:hypothetical protein
MSDFGADQGCGQVPKKLRDQYGITLAASTVRTMTEGHGEHMREQQAQRPVRSHLPGCPQPVGQSDGAMVPMVTNSAEAEDKRKHKTLQWQEAR